MEVSFNVMGDEIVLLVVREATVSVYVLKKTFDGSNRPAKRSFCAMTAENASTTGRAQGRSTVLLGKDQSEPPPTPN
jgi:hypothetical protein